MTVIDFVFLILRTPKTWLDKCLKIPVLEDPSTSNLVNVSEHCSNLHHNSFIILIDNFQGNSVEKYLCD